MYEQFINADTKKVISPACGCVNICTMALFTNNKLQTLPLQIAFSAIVNGKMSEVVVPMKSPNLVSKAIEGSLSEEQRSPRVKTSVVAHLRIRTQSYPCSIS